MSSSTIPPGHSTSGAKSLEQLIAEDNARQAKEAAEIAAYKAELAKAPKTEIPKATPPDAPVQGPPKPAQTPPASATQPTRPPALREAYQNATETAKIVNMDGTQGVNHQAAVDLANDLDKNAEAIRKEMIRKAEQAAQFSSDTPAGEAMRGLQARNQAQAQAEYEAQLKTYEAEVAAGKTPANPPQKPPPPEFYDEREFSRPRKPKPSSNSAPQAKVPAAEPTAAPTVEPTPASAAEPAAPKPNTVRIGGNPAEAGGTPVTTTGSAPRGPVTGSGNGPRAAMPEPSLGGNTPTTPTSPRTGAGGNGAARASRGVVLGDVGNSGLNGAALQDRFLRGTTPTAQVAPGVKIAGAQEVDEVFDGAKTAAKLMTPPTNTPSTAGAPAVPEGTVGGTPSGAGGTPAASGGAALEEAAVVATTEAEVVTASKVAGVLKAGVDVAKRVAPAVAVTVSLKEATDRAYDAYRDRKLNRAEKAAKTFEAYSAAGMDLGLMGATGFLTGAAPSTLGYGLKEINRDSYVLMVDNNDLLMLKGEGKISEKNFERERQDLAARAKAIEVKARALGWNTAKATLPGAIVNLTVETTASVVTGEAGSALGRWAVGDVPPPDTLQGSLTANKVAIIAEQGERRSKLLLRPEFRELRRFVRQQGLKLEPDGGNLQKQVFALDKSMAMKIDILEASKSLVPYSNADIDNQLDDVRAAQRQLISYSDIITHNRGIAREKLAPFDKDGDNKITFKDFDANGDGVIDAVERHSIRAASVQATKLAYQNSGRSDQHYTDIAKELHTMGQQVEDALKTGANLQVNGTKLVPASATPGNATSGVATQTVALRDNAQPVLPVDKAKPGAAPNAPAGKTSPRNEPQTGL